MNLDKIKIIANQLLLIEPEASSDFPFIVHHPFFNAAVVPYQDADGKRELINIMESEANLNKVQAFYSNVINKASTATHIFMMINKPYYMVFFSLIESYLDEKTYAELLFTAFKHQENPNRDPNVSVEMIKKYFKKANPAYLMSKEEQAYLDSLPDYVTIYRGVGPFEDYGLYGALSWTLSLSTANWFAERFRNKDGVVCEAKIHKDHIFAYFEHEQEVIVDYSYLEEVKPL